MEVGRGGGMDGVVEGMEKWKVNWQELEPGTAEYDFLVG